MTQPRTEEGRQLLAGLNAAMGTDTDRPLTGDDHGLQFRERIVEAVERALPAIEAKAAAEQAALVAALRDELATIKREAEAIENDDPEFNAALDEAARGYFAAHDDTIRRAERGRIRAGVEALTAWDKRSVPGGWHVSRAAVLDLLAEPLP